VDQITEDHEVLCSLSVDRVGQAIQIVSGDFVGNRWKKPAECGRFSQVQIGCDQSPSIREENQALGHQLHINASDPDEAVP
jgi:hypothetical protein